MMRDASPSSNFIVSLVLLAALAHAVLGQDGINCHLLESDTTLSGTFSISNCDFSGQSTTISLDPAGYLTLSLSRVRWDGGGLLFAGADATNLHLEVFESSFTDVLGHCLSVQGSTTVANVTIRLHSTDVSGPTQSAAAVIGTFTTIENVSVELFSSIIDVGVENSGDFRGGAGIVLRAHGSIQMRQVRLSVHSSRVAVRGHDSIVAVGVAFWHNSGSGIDLDTEAVNIVSVNSTVYASADRIVAALGWTLVTSDPSAALSIRNSTIRCALSSISSLVTQRFTSACGMHVFGIGSASLIATNVSISAVESGVIAAASLQPPAVALGAGSYSHNLASSAIMEATMLNIYSCNSTVSSSENVANIVAWVNRVGDNFFKTPVPAQLVDVSMVLISSNITSTASGPLGRCLSAVVAPMTRTAPPPPHGPASVLQDLRVQCAIVGNESGAPAEQWTVFVNSVIRADDGVDVAGSVFPGSVQGYSVVPASAVDQCVPLARDACHVLAYGGYFGGHHVFSDCNISNANSTVRIAPQDGYFDLTLTRIDWNDGFIAFGAHNDAVANLSVEVFESTFDSIRGDLLTVVEGAARVNITIFADNVNVTRSAGAAFAVVGIFSFVLNITIEIHNSAVEVGEENMRHMICVAALCTISNENVTVNAAFFLLDNTSAAANGDAASAIAGVILNANMADQITRIQELRVDIRRSKLHVEGGRRCATAGVFVQNTNFLSHLDVRNASIFVADSNVSTTTAGVQALTAGVHVRGGTSALLADTVHILVQRSIVNTTAGDNFATSASFISACNGACQSSSIDVDRCTISIENSYVSSWSRGMSAISASWVAISSGSASLVGGALALRVVNAGINATTQLQPAAVAAIGSFSSDNVYPVLVQVRDFQSQVCKSNIDSGEGVALDLGAWRDPTGPRGVFEDRTPISTSTWVSLLVQSVVMGLTCATSLPSSSAFSHPSVLFDSFFDCQFTGNSSAASSYGQGTLIAFNLQNASGVVSGTEWFPGAESDLGGRNLQIHYHECALLNRTSTFSTTVSRHSPTPSWTRSSSASSSGHDVSRSASESPSFTRSRSAASMTSSSTNSQALSSSPSPHSSTVTDHTRSNTNARSATDSATLSTSREIVLAPTRTPSFSRTASLLRHRSLTFNRSTTLSHTASLTPRQPLAAASPRPTTIPADVHEAIETTAAVTTAVAAIQSPTVGLGMTKLSAVGSFAECDFSHTESMPRIINPTGFEFGAAHGAAYRGTVVGNFILFFGVSAGLWLLAVAVAAVRYRCGTSLVFRSFRAVFVRTMADMHLPSLLFLPAAIVYEGTVAASMSIFVHATDRRDLAYGTFGMLACLCFPLYVLWFTALRSPFHCILQQRKRKPPGEGASQMHIAVYKVVSFMEHSTHKWVCTHPSDPLWKARNFFFFADFRVRPYVAMEFFSAFAIGIAEGTRIADLRVCLGMVFIPFIAALVLLYLLLWRDAALIRTEKIFIVGLNVLILSICVCTVIEIVLGGDGGVTDMLANAAFGLAIIKTVVDVVLVTWWAWNHRRKLFDAATTGRRAWSPNAGEVDLEEDELLKINSEGAAQGDEPLLSGAVFNEFEQHCSAVAAADLAALDEILADRDEDDAGVSGAGYNATFDPSDYLSPGHDLDELDEAMMLELQHRREEWTRRRDRRLRASEIAANNDDADDLIDDLLR